MLQEARGRLVDVETGDEPRPMRTLEEALEASGELSPQPGSRVSNDRAVNGASSTPAVAVSRGRPKRKAPVPKQPPPAPAPPPIAEPDHSVADLGTEELLWLEDRPDHSAAEPGDGSRGTAPWRRGLRG
jgi:hypothetical protein